MFAKLSTSLIATLIISTTTITTLAAPTQTHCRCEIVNDVPSSPAPASAAYTPSAAHWSPVNALPSPVVAVNVCASLGSKLEKLQHIEPEIYNSYMRGAGNDAQRPLPTSVLMNRQEEEGDDGEEEEEEEEEEQQQQQQEAQSTLSRSQGKIVCYPEAPSSPSEFHSSFVGLWALQIIVVAAVLACLAEGVHMAKRWMENKDAPELTCQNHGRLHLAGAEKRLLAIPTGPQQVDLVSSPGAEKKLRAYETTRYFVIKSPSGRREFTAYDDDSDDEANRPVM